MSKPCLAEGCTSPRHVTSGGNEVAYCRVHFRAKLRSYYQPRPRVRTEVCRVCGAPRCKGIKYTLCETHYLEWMAKANREAYARKVGRPVQQYSSYWQTEGRG